MPRRLEGKCLREMDSQSRRASDNRYMRYVGSGASGSEALEEPSLDVLLRRHDEDFVRTAYECLLGRLPDRGEAEMWLTELRGGLLSPIDVLIEIRYSAEGRARGTRISGLAPRRLVRMLECIPVVGYGVRWFRQLLLLPRLARRMNAVEANFTAYAIARARQVDQAFERIAGEVRRLDDRKADLRALDELSSRLQAIDGVLHRWGMLAGSTGDGRAESDRLEMFYRDFEDRFRGTSEEIRARLSFYVPILRAVADALSDAAPAKFADLGCGRGEMVLLLRDNGLEAYGVDTNVAMLAKCREQGLDVVHGDALEHLASLQAGSLAGVTAIHMAEHLPFRTLLMLFDEAYRVLRPGGVAIFETPNPENLVVGACNFYYDPTHVRQLPPEPTRYMLESCGFVRVAIERLHPGTIGADVDDARDPVTTLYRTMMLVPQDYALIAYKPSDNALVAGESAR
jgi:SAM-dependent methyltransferase